MRFGSQGIIPAGMERPCTTAAKRRPMPKPKAIEIEDYVTISGCSAAFLATRYVSRAARRSLALSRASPQTRSCRLFLLLLPSLELLYRCLRLLCRGGSTPSAPGAHGGLPAQVSCGDEVGRTAAIDRDDLAIGLLHRASGGHRR